MSDSESNSPLDALLQLPTAIVAELSGVLPRLAERTRSQLELAASVVEKLRCGDLGSRLSSMTPDDVTGKLADVVPFARSAAETAASTVAAAADGLSQPVREVIEVVTVSESKRSSTPVTATAAPAKKAPAKKTPAKKAAAKKAPAKKAPAKKAAATKAPAKTAPAKKAATTKAPAKKASGTAAPAKKPAPATKASSKKSPTATTSTAKKSPTKKTPVAKKVASPVPVPAASAVLSGPAGALAIPGYDALAASQVVPRLEALSATDLEQVRTYELANRGRRTILSRISQLQVG